ncbi:MAG TPA: DUF2934 domain-containing protein [Gemmataceae bacterium]|nr:DUF2934 domain-containing protein [Terriglobales bacterium]HLN29356.1 DUF2934 domain-containing protein [Gemmataceae bacterium]
MKRTQTIPPALPTAPPPTESASAVQEQIRRRAYELYEERRRADGRDLEDWLQAESEVTQQKAKTAAA